MVDRRTLLRERFEVGTAESTFFSYLVIGIVCWWLWNDADRTALILWGTALAICGPLPLLVQRSPASFELWHKRQVLTEVLLGVVWGFLPLAATPESPAKQALLAGVMLAVIIASAATSSQFVSLHTSFLAPCAILAVIGFLTGPTPSWVAALFIGVASAFSISISNTFRETHTQLVDVLVTNDELVSELGDERDALTEANNQLDRQAWFDSLTGLHNRAAMSRHFEELFESHQCGSGEERITVAYLDLDGFKQINDTKGHRVGDLVLIAVANRLKDKIADTGFLCRLGGDEITLLSQGTPPERVGERLAQVFDDPFQIEGQHMRISAGIGVATTSVPCTPEELLRFADRALYRHKARTDRTVRYKVFDTDMLEGLRQHETTQQELAVDFDAGAVNSWLQPIVSIETGEIVSAEALARWERADGVVSAGEFIPHLTERHLLGELADRTISQMADVHLALAAGGVTDFCTTVNVPPSEIEGVLRRHKTYGLTGMSIEITENEAAPDPERVAQVLQQARQAGAKVLVDDFGTGYSSLALINTLPIDGLKIDGSFVRNLADDRSRAVVSAIVNLGTSLGLMVIAECVESVEQANQLRELGVDHAQGYLYAPAVPTSELVQWVVSGHRLGPVVADVVLPANDLAA